MEAFAGRQDVRTVWSNEVARLDHEGTHAVLTALVLEDNVQPARKIRGVKVELSSGDARDQIYLDATATERTRAALEEIAQAVGRRGSPGRNGCMGAKEFWPLYDWPWNKYHELNADFCGDAQGSGLVLHGRGKTGAFRFPGETPTRLAEMLAAAVEQLKQH